MSLGRSLPVLGLVAGLVISSCHSEPSSMEPSTSRAEASRVRIGDIDWYVDYDAALEVAREQDKALWMHFGENPG